MAICGMISQYNAAGAVAPPRNLTQIMTKRLRLEGYIVTDHLDLEKQFIADMTQWHRDGLLHPVETVLGGIEQALDAFLGLFTGAHLGRTLVRLGQ